MDLITVNPLQKENREYSSIFRDLDKVIHEPARLGILTILYTIKKANFTYLKQKLDLSDGNISTHLRTLENSGYIKFTKSFVNRMPRTTYMITEKGITAFKEHIKKLEQIISSI
jgi:DNA-binding MarR family transcriptional regulator